MSRKPPTRATVESWIHNFPQLLFNGTELRCTLCDAAIAWTHKTSVLQHVKTDRHKALLSGTMSDSERQRQFNCDLLKFMVHTHIAFNRLNNPSFRQFLQNCVSGKYTNVSVPAESTLRKNYATPERDKVKNNIAAELDNKHISVCVNETINAKGQIVIHVLVGGMDEDIPMISHLISSTVVEQANAETISACVDKSLRAMWAENFETKKEHVLLFLTDVGSYMKTAGQILKNTYANMLHVTCLAHGLHILAETVKNSYPNVDELITSVMKVFLKAPSRKKLFTERLPNIPLPPEPVVTRWGTWLEAASYYYINFDSVKSVIDSFIPKDTPSISRAQQAFSESTLQEELAYIHGNFSRISLAIRALEYSPIPGGYSIDTAINIIFDLRNFLFQLSGIAADHVKTKCTIVLQNNPGFETLCRIVDLFGGKEVDFSDEKIDVHSLKNFMYFKYAPITLVDVERSLI